MQVFVTGATGFVGRTLVAELLARRWQVRALLRYPARGQRLPAAVRVVEGDLDDLAALRQGATGAAVVFHLAAATDGPWEQHAAVTVEGTRRVIAACHEEGVPRLVLVSSIVVYDKRGRPADSLLDESARLLAADAAAGAYARGKLEAERLAREYARGGDARTEVVIVRPGLVYGKERLAFAHLGELIGQTRIAYGRPSLLLPLVEVRSCADAMLRVATCPTAAGRSYNIVDAHTTTRRDWLRAIESAIGAPQRVIYLPAAPVAAAVGLYSRIGKGGDLSAGKIRARARELRYDTSSLQRDTGWQPLRTLAEGLGRCGLPVVNGVPHRIERVGIIGAGMIAAAHLSALRGVPGVRVTGVLDTNLAAARALAARAGAAAAFDETENFYDEAQPELVHILTPPHTHAALAREALRRRAHVLLEKPATTAVEDCDALVAEADASGLTIGVDETLVHDPLLRRARAALIHGVLGDLVHVDVVMSHDLRRGGRLERILRDPRSWEHRLPGGALEDLLPHPLSVVRALCGPLQLEHWQSRASGRLPCDAPDELRLSLADGALTAQVLLSLSARPDDFLLTIYGSRASLKVDVLNMLYDCLTPVPGPRALGRGFRVLRSAARLAGQTAANALVIALRRAPPPASPSHLIRAHYAALARGAPLPAPLVNCRNDIAMARTLWPASDDAPVERDVRADSGPAPAALPSVAAAGVLLERGP